MLDNSIRLLYAPLWEYAVYLRKGPQLKGKGTPSLRSRHNGGMKAPVAIGLAVAFFLVLPLLGVAWFWMDGMGKMRQSASQFVMETLGEALTEQSELLQDAPEAQKAVNQLLQEGAGWTVGEVVVRHARSTIVDGTTYHLVRLEAQVSNSAQQRGLEVTVRRLAAAAVEDVERLAKQQPLKRSWEYRELRVIREEL